MDTKEAIIKRRSIRKYQEKNVSDSIVEEVVNAARLAPSGHNVQPWRFFVVKDEATRNRLKEAGAVAQAFVTKAPVLIVCCGDPFAYKNTKDPVGSDDSPEIKTYRDVSIASAFLVLRATELGLGTCYVGWRHKEKIKEILDIPKNFVVPFVITLGYPAEKPFAEDRNKISEILTYKTK